MLIFILDAGRFGYGEHINILDLETKKNESAFIRCLRSEFSLRKSIEDDLECLILLNYK